MGSKVYEKTSQEAVANFTHAIRGRLAGVYPSRALAYRCYLSTYCPFDSDAFHTIEKYMNKICVFFLSELRHFRSYVNYATDD